MEDQDDSFIEDFCNSPYQPRSKPGRRRQTPHALLKHRCRNALTAWRQAHGVSVVLRKSYVGKATTAAGREVALGTRGESDDLFIIGKDGVLWAVVAPEYKAGNDRQSEVQKRYEEKCLRAGIVYVICRQPSDLTDALTQILAQRGGLF